MHTPYMSVRLGLLALLDRQESYGYQLKADFEAATGSLWPLNIGQVYTTLERLERDGLVVADERGEGDDRQRWYLITQRGRAELEDWFEAGKVDAVPPRDGLYAKVLLALIAGPDVALDVITRQRTALTGVLQARRANQRKRAAISSDGSSGPPTDEPARLAALAHQLVDDAVIARTEAELRWLDLCEARLAEIQSLQVSGRST